MVTIEELKTLRHGDYIEASGLYYKVLKTTPKGLYLTNPFCLGSAPKGRWFSDFASDFVQVDHAYWSIISRNDPTAKTLNAIISK